MPYIVPSSKFTKRQKMTSIETFEWFGTISSLTGAYLLAFNTRISRYGWIFFLCANVAMIIFSVQAGHSGVLTQSIGFMGSSLLGIYRAFVKQMPESNPVPIAQQASS
jgi:nicotinamide riboside transporter PnuC